MSYKPYGLICPITHACQILEPRWTIPIIAEMRGGATRFNDIKRKVGSISTALLSKRLRELEAFGLVERIEDPATGQVNYLRTPSGVALDPALDALGKWAQCNIEAQTALDDTDVSALMFQMRDYIQKDELPNQQTVIQFRFSDNGILNNTYWAVYRPGTPIETCSTIPGFEVDLYIETDRMSLCAILLGRTTYAREQDRERLFMSGDALLARTIDRWLPPRSKEKPHEILQLA